VTPLGGVSRETQAIRRRIGQYVRGWLIFSAAPLASAVPLSTEPKARSYAATELL